MKMRRRSSRGQAAVETAIVMPLFVFVVLGLLQITLMHQARLMTKYAAYKAARAGSIGRGKEDVMTNAALNVLVPIVGRATGLGVYNSTSGSDYEQGFKDLKNANASQHHFVKVLICAPTSNTGYNAKDDFDDPKKMGVPDAPTRDSIDGDKWKAFDTSKLAVQVTTYYRMNIPFVNMMIWWAAYASTHNGNAINANKVVRLGTDVKQLKHNDDNAYGDDDSWLKNEAESKHYIMPIRASYSMRMQSNFDDSVNLPSKNGCAITWQKK